MPVRHAELETPWPNDDEQRRLRASLDAIRSRSAEIARVFYDRLFESQPQLRSLFPDDMASQRGKFIVTLISIVDCLHDRKEALRVGRALSKRHVGYRAQKEHYPLVGEALLFALEQTEGLMLEPGVLGLWRRAYDLLAEIMVKA